MTLDEYLRQQGETGFDFARRIDVHASTVSRMRRGVTHPERRTIEAIFKATGGRVTANDFYGHGEAA